MKTLKIEPTQATPSVVIVDNKLEFKGRSYPEFPEDFYEKIKAKMNEIHFESLNFCFELDYVNTSSTKCIFELLKKAKETFNIKVTWVFEEDDEDIEELGMHISESLGVSFIMDSKIFV